MKRLFTLALSLLCVTLTQAQIEEDFSPAPTGWILSNGAAFNTIGANNGVVITPGVGGNNPAVIGTPAVNKTSNNIQVCLDVTAYTSNLNMAVPFPCATFMDVLFVNAAVTTANQAQMAQNIYARVDNHQLPTNGGNTCLSFTMPASVVAANFKVFVSFHSGCNQSGIRFVIDNLKINGVDDVCPSGNCAPTALDDAFIRGNMNELSFNAVLYGSNINYPAAPAGYAVDNLGTDNDANDTYTHLRWSLVTPPVNGTVVVNNDGTATITRNSNTVQQVTFTYQVCDDGPDDNFATTGDNLCDQGTITVTFPTNAPTPVSLINYTATRSGNTVLLKWATTFESINVGFEIQRMNENGEFKKIGFVDSKGVDGNSTVTLNYEFSEVNMSGGLSWYRLVQHDKDGASKIYLAKAVRGVTESANVTVYPNPSVNGTVTVLFGNNNKRQVSLTDMNGRVLKNWNNYANDDININALQPGVYMLIVRDNETNMRTVKKILVAQH